MRPQVSAQDLEDDAISKQITIPNVQLTLEDLLEVIQSLDQPSRARVARVVAGSEMDARFRDLIDQLAARVPADELSDVDLDREVQAVRLEARVS